MLLSISQAAPILGGCCKTLRRRHARGILYPDSRTSGGYRHSVLQTLETFLHAGLSSSGRRQKRRVDLSYTNQFHCAVIYARISALKQKVDWTRQITFLTQITLAAGFGEVYIYKDVASGLNKNRQGFKQLIYDAFVRNIINAPTSPCATRRRGRGLFPLCAKRDWRDSNV